MALIEQNIFNSETVFVLGAGANKPYNFPLGSELKQEIISNTNTTAILIQVGFDNKLIKSFREALEYSYHTTIDIFLEKKKKFREIGSYFITLTLLSHENPNFLFPQRDWYGDLFRILDFENEETNQSYPSFVTLNYDRSLEHFLNMNIEYNCQDEKLNLCHEKRERIKIVHAHGSFGDYPDVPYGQNASDPLPLRNAANRIKIISDRLDDSPDFQEAQQVISGASNVVFFGFGYDEMTLSKLLKKADIGSKKFYGTGVNIAPETKAMLQRKFGDNFFLRENAKCKELLEEIRLAMK